MLINEMPRYEILDEVVDAGARPRLAPDRQRARHRLPARPSRTSDDRCSRPRARRSRASSSSSTPTGSSSRCAKAPREFDLQARNPERTRSTSAASTWRSAPVYGCPFVREGLERREATYADFENLVRLAQAFPQLDTPGGTICEPNDKPLDSRHLDMVYALLTLSDKPFMGSVTSGPNAVDTIAMAEMVFGRESLERDAGDHLADQRQLAAALRRPHARRAARVREGEPGARHHAVPADGRDVAGLGRRRRSRSRWPRRSPGSRSCRRSARAARSCSARSSRTPTCSRARRASARPSRRSACSAPGRSRATTGCRSAAAAALTSSQTVDAQAAYEAAMTLWPTFLAGTNFVMHSAGWLESGLVSCYEKFIVDVEMLRMLHDVFQPLKINEETLAYRRAPGGGAGRPLPRRGAHARAVPRVLLPAAALVDRELRALDAERRQGRGGARDRRSGRRRSRSTRSRRSTRG